MVMKGQFLERPTVIPLGADALEALWHRGDRGPAVLLIPPPPEEGSMDDVVAAELAWACAQAGHPELRFNFRGVGASRGPLGARAARVKDAAAALELLEANTAGAPAVVLALGSSADVALALYGRVARMAGVGLVAPLGIPWGELGRLEVPLLVVLPQHGTQPRAEISEHVLGAGGSLEVVGSADARFSRGLPQLGHAVVRWLHSI